MIKTNDVVLKQFLQTFFNKKIDNITDEDLLKVDTVYVDSITPAGVENPIDFDLLNRMKNVKNVIISHSIISERFYDVISRAESLTLNYSTFKNESDLGILNKVKSLILNKCYIDSYDGLLKKLKELEYLEITYSCDLNKIDASNIPKTVIYLILNGINVNNLSALEDNENCELLSIMNSTISERVDFITNIKSLKILYISLSLMSEELYNQLAKKGITVHTNLYDFMSDEEDQKQDKKEIK